MKGFNIFHLLCFIDLNSSEKVFSPLHRTRLDVIQNVDKYHAPTNDKEFWDPKRWRNLEPSSVMFGKRGDVVNKPYVGDWRYNYRLKGMKTSTDDIIVAYLACASSSSVNISKYVDFGCGVGSTLLLVAHYLKPRESIGLEAQRQSFQLLQETIKNLPFSTIDENKVIEVLHTDLRHNDIEPSSVQLITANPPYAPLTSGTLCKDSQRRSARFEIRGAVEDYMSAAKRLLTTDGRFILSFWLQNDGDQRVRKAAKQVGMKIVRSIDVLMGDVSVTIPHITIYELMHIEYAHNNVIQGDEGKCTPVVNNFEPQWLEPLDYVEIDKTDNGKEDKFLLNITKTHGAGYSDKFQMIRRKLLMP